jgi:putative endonuclease
MIRCKDGRLYTGMTSDILRRFFEHKSGKGAKFTRNFGVDKLLYAEAHLTRSQAMVRESAIKAYPKAKKLSLIEKSS